MSANLKTTTSQSSVAFALETQFRKIDKHNSGLLKPKEFETALEKSGLEISKTEVQAVSKALEAASSSGMVAYQDVLTRIYDNIQASSGSSTATASAPTASLPADSPAASGNSTPQPQWYVSRQRRIKSEVALCMGQQPEATAVSAANVETPQEKARRQNRTTGKKIQGLSRPGVYDTTGSTTVFNGEINNENVNYWFSEYQKASDIPTGNAKHYHQGCGDGNGGGKELWFSKAGEDEKALKETGLWRPTKDASIGIYFTKRKNIKNETQDSSSGVEENENHGLPAPKPPIMKAKPAPP